MPNAYRKISPEILEGCNDHQLFQDVYEHILAILGAEWHPSTNVEKLVNLPNSAKNAWYSWHFACEVVANGMSGWVANCSKHAAEIIASHAALKAVGATELAELLEASFEPAKQWDAEFLREPEKDWFDQFPANPKFTSFETIDPLSYDLAADPLSSTVAGYLRSHKDEL